MKNRIISISLGVILTLSVCLIGCTAEVPEITKHTLTMSSTYGGNSTCVPGSGCTCGEGTESSGGLTVPEEYLCTEGTEVSIEATPDPGYRFIGWTGDVDTIADVNADKTTIIMNDDYSITANFDQILPKQFSLTISSTQGGSVTIPGEGYFTYFEGTVVNLMATPKGGYPFVKWTGDVGTIANVYTPSTNITMQANYLIVAIFGTDCNC